MAIHCEIHLENPSSGYFLPGQSVRGTIKYTLTKKKDFSNIIVSLKGRGRCEFSHKYHKHGYDDDLHNNKYNNPSHTVGEDVYVYLQTNLKSNVTLEAGEYTAPINFVLPHDIPPSYICNSGKRKASIVYHVSVKFSKPGIFTFAKRFRKIITVKNLLTPLESELYEENETLTKFFVKKKNVVILRVTWEKSIILPGDELDLILEINNLYNSFDITAKVLTNILRVQILKTNCGAIDKFEKMLSNSSEETERIRSGGIICYNCVIPIPKNDYTVRNSRIISREYKVLLTVKIPEFDVNTKLEIPILLGTATSEFPPEYASIELDPPPPSYSTAIQEANNSNDEQ